MDTLIFASGMIQISRVPCSIVGCIKRRMWFLKLGGLRCGDDGARVLKMCWTLVCMRTGTILQIQFSCKNAKYSIKTSANKNHDHCPDCYFAGFLFRGFRRSWIVGECATITIKSEPIETKSYLMVLPTISMIHLRNMEF